MCKKRRERRGLWSGFTNHVSHSLGFNTTGHAARCPGSLDFILITFCEIPDGVVWMAENPEIISADVGEFLKVGFEYSGLVQALDKFVRGNRDFWRLSGSWGRGKEQRANEGERALVRMWEGNEVAVGGSSEHVLVVP